MADAELNEQFFCNGCMHELKHGQTICPYCGYDNVSEHNNDDVLREGTVLAGSYLSGKTLGRGGFGVTYLGYDFIHHDRVAIKEYFPMGISVRNTETRSVLSISSTPAKDSYIKGMEAFRKEAENLSRINSPYIVRVRKFFQENGTAYIVMDHIGGHRLDEEVIDCGGRLPWRRVMNLFNPLIVELGKLHDQQLIHRDIKPTNIKVLPADRDVPEHLVLLDFGAARSYVTEKITKTYTAVVTPGFAPLEQYSSKSKQGPFTDVYAICATMYATITGEIPPSATDRIIGAVELKPISDFGLNVPSQIEQAIMHGMEVKSEARTQTMRDLYQELFGKGSGNVPIRGQTTGEDQSSKQLIYDIARERMAVGTTVEYREAVYMLQQIRGYRDADQLVQKCHEEMERIHRDEIYQQGKDAFNNKDYEKALNYLNRIAGWRDSQVLITECQKHLGTYVETKKSFGLLPVLVAAAMVVLIVLVLLINPFDWNIGSSSKSTATPAVTEVPASEWADMALRGEEAYNNGNYSEALQLFMPAADSGDASAQFRLGYMYMNGEGVTESSEEAVRYYQMAADQNHPSAQHWLGYMYENGKGVTKSNEMAVRYYRLSADNGDMIGQYALGRMYENGSGIEQSYEMAMRYYQMSADQGYEEAQTALENLQERLASGEVDNVNTQSGQAFTNLNVGDVFTFGTYEQDNDTSNGTEPIEWQVLSVSGGRALVISTRGLDCQPYHRTQTAVTWETCSLRTWLNDVFFNSAFSDSERSRIAEVTNSNPDNETYHTTGGNDTTDRIFLLSLPEARTYFSSDSDRICDATPYAQSRGSKLSTVNGHSWWLLRSPGDKNYNCAFVATPGMIVENGLDDTDSVLRPVFWLTLGE